ALRDLGTRRHGQVRRVVCSVLAAQRELASVPWILMAERTATAPLTVACVGILVLLFAACGCGSSRTLSVSVPPVDTTVLDTALKRLAAVHLRVQLTDFGPLPAGYELGSADVGDQDPEAATRVK